MANENQNTGPNTPGADRNQTKQIVSDLGDVKRAQGDFNDTIKESINLLKKIDRSYQDIQGRIEAMDKSQINIRQVNNELYKIRQKEVISSRELLKAQQQLSAESNNKVDQYLKSQTKISDLESRRIEYEKSALKAGSAAERKKFEDSIASVDYLLNAETARSERLKDGLSTQEAQVIALKKANDIAKEGVKFGEDKLKSEKEINSSIGITGRVMGIIGKKLGANNDVYGDMVENARELNKVGAKLTFGDKLKFLAKSVGAGLKQTFTDPLTLLPMIAGGIGAAFKLASAGLDMVGNAAASAGNFMAGLSEDSGNVVRGLTSGVSDLARKIPLVGGLIGGLIDGFSALLDLVLGVDNMIVKTGRQLNLSAEGARNLYRNLAAASQASGDIYMNGKKYLESQLELTQELGTTNTLSAEILRTNVQLKDFAGLEADTRARIAESAKITGQEANDTVKAVLGQVVGLQRATGISFQYQKILKEASSLGGYLGLQFAKYPEKLTKALVSTKALGLELKQLDGMANSFLDFESSISKEFEAQLLIGKDINLNKAREAFLNNDLAGAAAEIAKYTGDVAGFNKLNRIQQESLADAMGMSRDELSEMLKQQELYSKFGVKSREDLLKQVDLLRKAGKEQEAINKAGGEAAYNDLVRASAQEKLALTIEKIKQSIVEFIERSGIIEKVEKFVDKLSNPDTIKGIIGTIRDTISNFIEFAGEILADIIEVGGEIANFFTFGEKGDARERAAYELGAKIRAGSLEMSKNVRGNPNAAGSVSVQDNVAKDKVKSEGAAVENTEKRKMVANPSNREAIVINQKNEFVIDDGINKAVTRYSKGSYQDQQSGQTGYVAPEPTYFA